MTSPSIFQIIIYLFPESLNVACENIRFSSLFVAQCGENKTYSCTVLLNISYSFNNWSMFIKFKNIYSETSFLFIHTANLNRMSANKW